MALLNVWERPGVWFSHTNQRLEGHTVVKHTSPTAIATKTPLLNQLEDKKPTEIQS